MPEDQRNFDPKGPHKNFVGRRGAAAAAPAPAPAPLSAPDGTVDEVVSWAGDDPDRRAAALSAEAARGTPRKGIVDALT